MSEDEPLMYMKTYRSGADMLIAVCDCDLIGKRFADGSLQIEICSDFFGAAKATIEELEVALSKATIANLVGMCSVGHAIRLGYIDQENVLVIEGTPCAQMVLV